MRSSLRVAVAQPVCRPGRVDLNVAEHTATIRAAAAAVVVFPELSLTGYDLDAHDIEMTSPHFDPIITACAEMGSVALVGAPVRLGRARHIAMLSVRASGVEVAYCKSFLGGDEHDRFARGRGPAWLEVDGWRIGLGICKDTRMADHITSTIDQGIDVYVAGLVHAPHERDELDARAARIVHAGRVPVAFASAAGAVGPAYPTTAGHSGIWDRTGAVLARAGSDPGVAVVAELAVD